MAYIVIPRKDVSQTLGTGMGACCAECADHKPCASTSSGLGASTPMLESPGKAAAAGAITGVTVGLVAGPIGALIGGAIGAAAGGGAGLILGKKAKKQKKKAKNQIQAEQARLLAEQQAADQAALAAEKSRQDAFRSAKTKATIAAKGAASRASNLATRNPDNYDLASLAEESVEIGDLVEGIEYDDPEALNKLGTLVNQANQIIATLDSIARGSGLSGLRTGRPMSRRRLSGLGDISPALGPWLESVRKTNRVMSGLPAGPLALDGLGADEPVNRVTVTQENQTAKQNTVQTILAGLLIAGSLYALTQDTK